MLADLLMTATKSLIILFPTFRETTLAITLYKPKQIRGVWMPRHVENRKTRCRKPRSMFVLRDSNGNFVFQNLMGPAKTNEAVSMMDTTPTLGASKWLLSILTKHHSPAAPSEMNQNFNRLLFKLFKLTRWPEIRQCCWA